MELQQSSQSQAQQSSFIEWAVGRKEKPNGPHRALLPIVKSSPSGTVAAVIDAILTGDEGIELANTAASVLEEYTHQPLVELFSKTENRCRGSKGVAMSAIQVITGQNMVSWWGVGNVQAVLFHRNPAADPRIERIERNTDLLGTGQCILREYRVHVKPGDLIILASGGLNEEFIEALPIDGKPRLVADELLAKYCKDDTDCAIVVVRYLGSGTGEHRMGSI